MRIYKEIADRLRGCILRGDMELWQRVFMISDDVTMQSARKWFEDYFVMHRAVRCEIVLDHAGGHAPDMEFKCRIKVEYEEYDDYVDYLLIRIGVDQSDNVYKIISTEQIYLPSGRNNLLWAAVPGKEATWCRSYLAREMEIREDEMPYMQLARAITRNVRFRETHIQLECASLLTCMMSGVIAKVCRQLNLSHIDVNGKARAIYGAMRDKFMMQTARPDRDNTWSSKFLAPWYGIEEILANHDEGERIPVSCNAFMTILYSLLRWNGFKSCQLIQFRIINQDYLIIHTEGQEAYLASHEKMIRCSERSIYPSGKISKAFGAEWYIDFKNNNAEINADHLKEYNTIAKNTFLPTYGAENIKERLPPVDPALSLRDFRREVFHLGSAVYGSIYAWIGYANQTLHVPKPEAFVYWSVNGNWGPTVFRDEGEVYDYIGQMQTQSIFPESDRVMTADQCIRHKTGGGKDIAIFLYSALKKFLNAHGYIVFTRRCEYVVYRFGVQDKWVVYNIRNQKTQRTIRGDILLVFNDTSSYCPYRDNIRNQPCS